jgi:hypothetical protein
MYVNFYMIFASGVILFGHLKIFKKIFFWRSYKNKNKNNNNNRDYPELISWIISVS